MATDAIDDLLDEAFGDGATQFEGPSEAKDREGYAWAADAFWVYDHIGERLNKKKAGSSGRYAMWKWAKEEQQTFFQMILPKAMALLERARDNSQDDVVVANKEKKAIRELRDLLRKAVKEAKDYE